MLSASTGFLPNVNWQEVGQATLETLYIVFSSTVLGYLLGLPMGVVLTVTDKDGIAPNRVVYKILDVIINILRSAPFIILMIIVIPFTRLIVGKSYGPTATIVPLVIAAAPFIARMVESSLKEVDHGVVEAAQSLGASNMTIVTKVLLKEARTSLIVGLTIAFATILGYSAMAGAIGGGGLGTLAINYGYHRYKTDVMVVTLIILILMVQFFQWAGMKLARALDRRNR
jgi:D-methionine transport system permease protein